MFALAKLLGTIRALADAVSALAGTVAEANQVLRDRLQLDVHEGPPAGEADPNRRAK